MATDPPRALLRHARPALVYRSLHRHRPQTGCITLSPGVDTARSDSSQSIAASP